MPIRTKVLLLLLGACFSNAANSFALPEIKTHSIAKSPTGVFTISGPDPYLIVSPLGYSEGARHLSLGLHFSAIPGEQESVPMELFFKASDDQPPLFDPAYRVAFSVPSSVLMSDNNTITIPLPSNELPNIVRLDIDRCAACRFTVSLHASKSEQRPANTTLVQTTRVFNGLTRVPVDGLVLDAIENWQTKDLALVGNNIQVTGDDPYLVSPFLDTDASGVAGIYLRLKTSDDTEGLHDFQLFYATEAHRFSEKASTSIKLKSDTNGRVEFLIPLGFLSSESPQIKALESIRLDLSSAQIGDTWQIEEARLIPGDSLAKMTHLIPDRILEVKRQRAKGVDLFLKSVTKVTSDLGFTISYLFLLIIVSVGFWRAYRK